MIVAKDSTLDHENDTFCKTGGSVLGYVQWSLSLTLGLNEIEIYKGIMLKNGYMLIYGPWL